MSVLPLRLAPDPILRQKAKRVRNIDGSIRKLVEDMIDSMRASQGVGLAAPQIGVSLRVIVIQVPDQDVLTLINPSIVRRTGERDVQEGCLSIPGYRGEIKRAKTVVAKGLGLDGKEIRVKAQELLAQALEHEIGHIRGVLYTDLLESMDKMYKVEPPKKEEEE
ncbi:MAG: peptide deformylase [Chloroflexi bacterium]|nr:peptide deformylase [Chloroflexota bacterium]